MRLIREELWTLATIYNNKNWPPATVLNLIMQYFLTHSRSNDGAEPFCKIVK